MKGVAEWLRGYSRRNLRLDTIAGLSLAAFVIPKSLAYASLADLPPVSGLYCYLVAGIAYAVLGTSRQLAVGPTSSLAIAVAASIAVVSGGDPARAVANASAIALLLGIICIGGRFIGLANIAYFLSDTVVTGFKTGAAFYIASTQLPKLFGIEGVSGNFFERLYHVVLSLPHAHMPSLVVGLSAIALFVILERTLPGRPTTLIVVAAVMVAAHFLKLDRLGVHMVGELPSGLPADRHPGHPHHRSGGAGADGVRLLPAGLRRGDLRRAHLRAKARLRDRSRPGADRPRRRQRRDRFGARLPGLGRQTGRDVGRRPMAVSSRSGSISYPCFCAKLRATEIASPVGQQETGERRGNQGPRTPRSRASGTDGRQAAWQLADDMDAKAVEAEEIGGETAAATTIKVVGRPGKALESEHKHDRTDGHDQRRRVRLRQRRHARAIRSKKLPDTPSMPNSFGSWSRRCRRRTGLEASHEPVSDRKYAKKARQEINRPTSCSFSSNAMACCLHWRQHAGWPRRSPHGDAGRHGDRQRRGRPDRELPAGAQHIIGDARRRGSSKGRTPAVGRPTRHRPAIRG